jgi:hypothetical protein
MKKPQGVFDLNDSDHCIGSYFLKSDIKEILNVADNDLSGITFKNIDGYEVCHERIIKKLWKDGKIPNAIPVNRSSFYEVLLIAIIKRVYPNIIIERQSRVMGYFMDLKLTMDKKTVYIEYDGPDHFTNSQRNPFDKKNKVEKETRIEVVNWPYWIQTCSSNVKAIFEKNIVGLGVLWSTATHFSMFYFEDSAGVIETLSKKFNAIDDNGFGYFYESNTKHRNNPEHPIIKKIRNGEKDISVILPKGFKDINYLLPNELKK